MISKRIGGLCAAFGLALGLGACTDDYGYGGVQVGYGNAGYYGDPYGYDGIGGAGYGYGGYGYGGYAPSYFGWYGNYFYPGTGIYVYDQYRRPFRWNDTQRRYWSGQQRYRGRDWSGNRNWNGFDRRNGQNGGYGGNGQWQQNRNGGAGRWNGNPGVRNDGRRQGNPGVRNDGINPGARSNRGNSGGQLYQRTPGTESRAGVGRGQWSGRAGNGRSGRGDTRPQ